MFAPVGRVFVQIMEASIACSHGADTRVAGGAGIFKAADDFASSAVFRIALVIDVCPTAAISRIRNTLHSQREIVVIGDFFAAEIRRAFAIAATGFKTIRFAINQRAERTDEATTSSEGPWMGALFLASDLLLFHAQEDDGAVLRLVLTHKSRGAFLLADVGANGLLAIFRINT